MKKYVKAIIKILAEFITLLLAYSILLFAIYNADSFGRLGLINSFQIKTMALTLGVVTLLTANIARALQNHFIKPEEEKIDDDLNIHDFSFKPKQLKDKVLCYIILFVCAVLIFGLGIYTYSIVSQLFISIKTLIFISSLFGMTAVMCSVFCRTILKPLFAPFSTKTKKEKIMYTPEPINTDNISLTEDLFLLTEKLAKNTHDVWALSRIKDGWKYGKQRNDVFKETPCLVEYELLPESEKQYDRNTVAETLKLIIKLGYKIEKIS